jgi:hypothetical protein
MCSEPDGGMLTTETKRRRGDITYDVFDEIESYCKTHHFTIFYGTVENEGFPKAVWDRDEDPRWESFLSLAKSFDVRTIYLHRSTFTSHDVLGASAQVRRTHTDKITAFSRYIGMIAYVEVGYLSEGLIHTFLYCSEWYTDFVKEVGLAPPKRDKESER